MTLKVIAFDGDDTLWDNQIYYDQAERKVQELVAPWLNRDDYAKLIIEIETRRVGILGFGAQSFTLSLLELVSRVVPPELSGGMIHKVIEIGQSVATADYSPIPHAKEVVEQARSTCKTILITKGNHFEQSVKFNKNGFIDSFDAIEIVPNKDTEAYEDVAERHGFKLNEMMMIGNSLKSDIRPLIGHAARLVHIPYRTTWALEQIELTNEEKTQVIELKTIADLPQHFAPSSF